MRISDWSSDVCSSDLGWLTAAILFSLVSYRAFARLPLGDPRLPGIAELRICNRHAAAAALLWTSPFWLQGASPGLDHSLAMRAIALLMLLTPALVVHSVPCASSDESRVGKTCDSTCRYRWSPSP